MLGSLRQWPRSNRVPDMTATAKPNFFILGAAKAGTTALAAYLAQHPQIYMSPVKEPHFFALENEKPTFLDPGDAARAVTHWSDYLGLFADSHGEIAIGEASTTYLHSAKAAAGIHERFPSARLIVILRQPIERAYSAFVMYRRENREDNENLLAAIEHEHLGKHYSGEEGVYLNRGFYSQPLMRYFNLFGRDNVKVYLYEEFQQQPQVMLNDLHCYVGVDQFQPNMSVAHNVGGLHKTRTLKSLLTRPNPVRFLARSLLPEALRIGVRERIKYFDLQKAPAIDAETWSVLLEKYREDILSLQDLIGRDLAHWLRSAP